MTTRQEDKNVFALSHPQIFKSDYSRFDEILQSTNVATPVLKPSQHHNITNERFVSRNNSKKYELNRKYKMKVKTVGEIRSQYEQNTFEIIKKELESCEQYLLKSIKQGILKSESKKVHIAKIINKNLPLSRGAWRMLTQVNVDSNKYSTQYVFESGKKIKLIGSKGGKKELLKVCNTTQNPTNFTCEFLKPKPSLLQNSLNINFRPGPLSLKPNLDDSYQKNNIGHIKIEHFPEIGLEIKPTYGIAFDKVVCDHIISTKPKKNEIDQAWATFAVSCIVRSPTKALEFDDSSHIFKLNYLNNKKRLIMRKDEQKCWSTEDTANINQYVSENLIEDIVYQMLQDITKSVEISLHENEMCSYDSDLIELSNIEEHSKQTKLHNKHKTQIVDGKLYENVCSKPYCKFGCICKSLNLPNKYRSHCGLNKCMFICKCYYNTNSYRYNINNDSVIDQKFSVITSHHSNPHIESHKKIKLVTVVVPRLDITNVEPWCMVHQLYRCFCKGIFTKSDIKFELNYCSNEVRNEWPTKMPAMEITEIDTSVSDNHCYLLENHEKDEEIKGSRNAVIDYKTGEIYSEYQFSETSIKEQCSRTTYYPKLIKRMDKCYYKSRNRKLNELEVNDKSLEKLLNERIINCLSEKSDKTSFVFSNMNMSSKLSKVSFTKWFEDEVLIIKGNKANGIPLELCPPSKYKRKLFPWNFILERYYEVKNYFYVINKMPHTILIKAKLSDGNNKPMLLISDIKQNEIHKFPRLVQNLYNKIEQPDCYAILIGHTDCWELYSVAIKTSTDIEKDLNKIPILGTGDTEKKEYSLQNQLENINKDCLQEFSQQNYDLQKNLTSKNEGGSSSDHSNDIEYNEESKWYILNMINDFTELHFPNKGFFVKYTVIESAINSARASSKTVQLAPKVGEVNNPRTNQNELKFAIYAVSYEADVLVFVGPYNINDTLGMKIFNGKKEIKAHSGMGFFVNVYKEHNSKIVKNPSSFIIHALTSIGYYKNKNVNEKNPLSQTLSECQSSLQGSFTNQPIIESKAADDPVKTPEKKVKPIRIKKDSSFYILSPINILSKNMSLVSKSKNEINSSNHQNSTVTLNEKNTCKQNLPHEDDLKSLPLVRNFTNMDKKSPFPKINMSQHINNATLAWKNSALKPVTCSQTHSKDNLGNITRPQGNVSDGRSVLIDSTELTPSKKIKYDDIGSKVPCHSPITIDIVDSDDEDTTKELDLTADSNKSSNSIEPRLQDIWIVCSTVNTMGYLNGKLRNKDGYISFDFPGFCSSWFYPKKIAFLKINQVLSRKVCVAKDVKLEWMMAKKNGLINAKPLNPYYLQSSYVLTSRGFCEKNKLKYKVYGSDEKKLEKAALPSEVEPMQDEENNC